MRQGRGSRQAGSSQRKAAGREGSRGNRQRQGRDSRQAESRQSRERGQAERQAGEQAETENTDKKQSKRHIKAESRQRQTRRLLGDFKQDNGDGGSGKASYCSA